MTPHDADGSSSAHDDARDATPTADLDGLVAVIFHELRHMAHRHLAREREHHTLQTTELVHEAYLRLAGHADVARRGKAYFFASAARAMRQVLVDASRRRNAGKRGDGIDAMSLDDHAALVDAFSHEMLDLDDALQRLARQHARAAQVVECRFFAGMTVEDTALALGVSPRTVKADWATARAWLHDALHDTTASALPETDHGDHRSLDPLDVTRAAALLDRHEAPASGVAIDGYEVIRELGRGGSGVVLLATDREQGTVVALKVLARWLCADPQASQRFLGEVRAIAQIDSPRIATVVRSGATDDGQMFIAMEYLDGTSLRARLAAGPLTVSESIAIALQVAEGLGHAHAHGIIHRDIKPENVMLTSRGVRIVDFGIAKLDGEALTRPGTLLGTAAYMSPEQAAGEIVDHRTDLWSLGTMIHEMLTGTRPFGGGDTAEVLRRIRSAAPTPIAATVPDVPARLLRVLSTSLAKQREHRYPSAATMHTALSLCQAGR